MTGSANVDYSEIHFNCIKILYNIEILPDFSSRIIKCDSYYNENIFSVFSWKAMVFLK